MSTYPRPGPSVSRGLPSWWRTKVTTMSLPMAWTLKGTKLRGRRSSREGLVVFGAVVPIGISIPAWLQGDFVESVVEDVDRPLLKLAA